MQKMFEVSPVRYVNEVKTPTLICLGAKDKRVPPSQGVEYFHLLQSLGVESKLLVFPEDCHAIDKPKTEAEHWIAIASWLKAKLA
jgi:acylaminoacyl-peptidase